MRKKNATPRQRSASKRSFFCVTRTASLQPNLDLRRDIVRQIRLLQPDIVVTCDPTVFWFGDRGVNHPDHRAIGEATLRCGLPDGARPPEFPSAGTRRKARAAQDQAVVHLRDAPRRTIKIDVTDYVETKIMALREHKSQIADMEAMAERLRGNRDPEALAEYPRYMRIVPRDYVRPLRAIVGATCKVAHVKKGLR